MSVRTERVARLIQKEIAGLLNSAFSEQVGPMVTVTGTRISKDLSIAYVYFSIYGSKPEERKATFRHIEELKSQIRAALAQRIRHQVRKIPELRFFLDETHEEVEKIEGLFDKIRAERDARGDSSGP